MKSLSIFLFCISFLMSAETDNKINEYCYLKASIFNEHKRLYEHEYNRCINKYTNKYLLEGEILILIEKEKELQRKYKNLQKKKKQVKIYNKKNYSPDRKNKKTFFNLKTASCYEVGLAYGACSIRSMNDIACIPGTNFAIPFRCKGKLETKKGIRTGILVQQQLINRGVYD